MNLLAVPILMPLAFGALSLTLWHYRRAQRWLAVVGTAALIAVSLVLLAETLSAGILVLHMGNWQAPFGISLVSDLLAASMVVMTGLMGFAVALYSMVTVGRGHESHGYYPLLHILLAAVCGSFLTGDIFNLYVWFEVMLIASFALLVLGGERAQMEGAIKYVTINLFSSAMFLAAVGLLYGLVGSLNMADIAVRLQTIEQDSLVTVIAMLFLISFGIKAAAFPLFFWLPASYHTPQVAVSALFAGLLTKVGVYVMYRVFTLIFTNDTGFTHGILLWMAALTMLTGVLGAAAQSEFRRILSFHITSQIGYMILGLALFTPLALTGGVFYILHHIVVKTNLFLISGAVYRISGSYQLDKLGGLYRSRPGLSLLFLVPALSLAGLPPLSGFFAKFVLIRASIEADAWAAVAVALLVSFLTLYSMIKIWNEAFWKARPASAGAERQDNGGLVMLYLPIALLAALTITIGLAGQPVYELAERAAQQLLDRDRYIEAVLGGAS